MIRASLHPQTGFGVRALCLVASIVLVSCGETDSSAQNIDGRRSANALPEDVAIAGVEAALSSRADALAPTCFRSARRPECGVEVPARYETIISRLPCRLPEFGIETHVLQADYDDQETVIRVDDDDFCFLWSESSPVFRLFMSPAAFAAASFVAEHSKDLMFDKCKNQSNDNAHVNLGPDAYAVCSCGSFKKCEFPGANTYVTYSFRVRYYIPVYRERTDDPACPLARPPQQQMIADAVYRECRHPLNGVDPDGTCAPVAAVGGSIR